MKKLLIALGIVAAAGLLGFAAVWACCGESTFPIDVTDIVVDPNPVPCGEPYEPVTISFNVVVGSIIWPDPGYELDRDTYATVYINGAPVGTVPTDDPPAGWGMSGTYAASVSWTPTAAGTYTLRIEAFNGSVKSVPGPDIVVEPCCVKDIGIEITPQTFDVTRAGNYVIAHGVLPPGASMVTGATIVKIGTYDVSIPGTVKPDTTIQFSSAEFSETAALIVKAGDPRAMDVEVRIDIDLADPDAQPCEAYYADKIDIINQGKKKK